MIDDEIIENIKRSIGNNLSEVVCSDYIFLDLPYYDNIGDILIWKGTEEYLSKIPHKCLYKTSIENYRKPNISHDVVILFSGGGNMGDLWRRHTTFVLKVLQDFPNNPSVILPQTVYYSDEKVKKQDIEVFSEYKKLIICARDNKTFKDLSDNFKYNKILLVPDMAFYISRKFISKYKVSPSEIDLFLKRNDKEYCSYEYEKIIDDFNLVEQSDWPSIEGNLLLSRFFNISKKILYRSRGIGVGGFLSSFFDFFAQKIYMPYLLKLGIKFISSYNKVYTTRLHGALLALLLGKEVVFFDNIYGKNSSVYDTWLKSSKSIKFIPSDGQ